VINKLIYLISYIVFLDINIMGVNDKKKDLI